jgi:hypothetical protein
VVVPKLLGATGLTTTPELLIRGVGHNDTALLVYDRDPDL